MIRSSEELLAAGRARLMRDTDPAIVEAGRLSRLAFAERIGSPRRCDTHPSECHPADGSCLYCGAWNGESCRAERLK